MRFRFAVSAVLLSLSAISSTAALGQNWPTKPVRFINPFPAGGGVDTFARPLSAKLTQSLGQTFFVENQGGAGGTVGATNASRAAPKEIVDRIYGKTAKVLQQSEVKEIWASQGATAGGQTPGEFAKFVRSEIEKWGKVVKDAGIKIDL